MTHEKNKGLTGQKYQNINETCRDALEVNIRQSETEKMPIGAPCHDSEVEFNKISETKPTKTEIKEIPNIQSETLGADTGPVINSKLSGTGGIQEVTIFSLISLHLLL